MTFAQLQYLLEIYQAGSVSQAAKNLLVSQPSISLTLKALEEELGYPIFLRTRKGLVPTSQGAEVIDHATRICESYRLLTAPPAQRNTFVRISSASTCGRCVCCNLVVVILALGKLSVFCEHEFEWLFEECLTCFGY